MVRKEPKCPKDSTFQSAYTRRDQEVRCRRWNVPAERPRIAHTDVPSHALPLAGAPRSGCRLCPGCVLPRPRGGGLHPHDLITSQRPRVLTPSPWALGSQHRSFAGTREPRWMRRKPETQPLGLGADGGGNGALPAQVGEWGAQLGTEPSTQPGDRHHACSPV